MFWGGPALLGVDRSQSPGHGEGTEAGPCRCVLTQGPCLWGNKLPWKVSGEVESSGLREGGAARFWRKQRPFLPHPTPSPFPELPPSHRSGPSGPALLSLLQPAGATPTCLPRVGAAW